MITRRVKTQVLIFIVVGLLAVSYIAVRYVGLLRLFGVGVYTVHVELPSAGGIFPNAEVDYRGVPVGRVGDVTLTATGVDASLQLNTSARADPDERAGRRHRPLGDRRAVRRPPSPHRQRPVPRQRLAHPAGRFGDPARAPTTC